MAVAGESELMFANRQFTEWLISRKLVDIFCICKMYIRQKTIMNISTY